MIFDHAPVGIAHFNHLGVLLDCNNRFADILGAPKEKFIGTNTLKGVKDSQMRKVITAVAEGKIGRFEGDYTSVVSGKTTPVRVQVGGIVTPKGRWRGAVGLFEDTSDIRQAESLRMQTGRLSAVAELASGVAHHFNNMLQVIMSGAQIGLMELEMGDVDNVKNRLTGIMDSSRFGADTVRRLRNFVEMFPRAVCPTKTVDMSVAIVQAIENTRTLWETEPAEKGLEIRMTAVPGPDCVVNAVEDEVVEVIGNLIKNSVEAMPEGGEIHIETCRTKDKEGVVLRVKDTGVGIPQKDIEKVFDPFFTTKGLRTVGLGLAAAYGIVKAHSGTISVTGEVGQGAVVTIELPAAPIETDDEVVEAAAASAPVNLRILAVDDMEPLLIMLKDGLQESAHTVTTAASGLEALELFQKERFDVVICDLGMPGIDGWEVGKRIKAFCEETGRAKTPFIVLTGWGGQVDEKRKIVESGVDALVEKPADLPRLLAVIREVMARQGRA
jgi:PAS domain S-box-containing protein